MRLVRFLINSLVLILPLTIVGVGAYRCVHRIFAYLNSNARLAATLSTEATRALHREVRVGDVRITGNLWGLSARNSVELRNVFVAQSPSAPGPAFARVDKVFLQYSLDQILYGDVRTPFVEELRLIHPQVSLARDQKGHWNFADFPKSNQPTPRPLVDKISVTNGAVFLEDFAFPTPHKVPEHPLYARATGLNGVGVIREDKSVSFDVTGRPDSQLAQDFHATGIVFPTPLTVSMRLRAQRVNLPFLADRFVPRAQVQIPSGAADLDLNAVYTPPPGALPDRLIANALRLNGTVKLTGLRADAPELGAPLSGMGGTLTFTNTSLAGDVSGHFADYPIHITGSLLDLPDLALAAEKTQSYQEALTAPHTPTPVFQIQTALPDTDLARLARILKVDRRLPGLPEEIRSALHASVAQGSIALRLEGPVNSPAGSLIAHLHTARYGTIHAQNLDLQAQLANRIVTADLHAGYAQGDAVIHARVALDDVGAFQVEAHGRRLKLAEMGTDLNQLQGGTGDLDLAMSGRKGFTPSITAQAQVQDAQWNGQTFHSLYASAATVGRDLFVKTMRVEDPKGFALASGKIDLTNGKLDMQVEADALDLHAMVAALNLHTAAAQGTSVASLADLEGVGYLRKGVLSGTIDDPEFQAEVSAFAIQDGKIAVDKALASFRLTRAGLEISKASIERYPSLVTLSGNVADLTATHPKFDITVHITDLDLDSLAELSGLDTQKYLITGTLSTEGKAGIRLVGTPEDFRAEGLASNTPGQPFTVSLQRASVNGLKLTDAHAEAYYDKTGMHLTTAHVSLANGTMTAAGEFGTDGELRIDLKGGDLDLTQLTQALPGVIAPELAGKIGFDFHIGGKPDALSVEANQLSAQGLTYRTFAIGEAVAQAHYQDKRIEIRNVRLTDPATKQVLVTAPRLDYDLDSRSVSSPAPDSGQTVVLQNISFQKLYDLYQNIAATGPENLQALQEQLQNIQGTLTVRVGLSGPIDDVQAEVVLDTHNVKVQDYLITSLTGSATVSRLAVRGPNIQLTIQPASLPSGQGAGSQKQQATLIVKDFDAVFDGDLKADVDITNVNLAFLQKEFAPQATHVLTGVGDKIGILASGKTRSPHLELSVSLSGVGIDGKVLDRVDLDHATVEEGQIHWDGLRVTKMASNAKSYQAGVSGTIKGFRWSAPYLPEDAALDLTAEIPTGANKGARADLKLLADLGYEQFRDSAGTLGSTLHVTGTRSNPQVSGSLAFSSPTLRIPGMMTGLAGVDAQVSLQNDLVTVQHFTAKTQVYDKKGMVVLKRRSDPLELTGSIPLGLSDTPPPAQSYTPLTLTANSVLIDEPTFPGAKTGGVSGSAAFNVKVTRSLKQPLISGTITATDASVALPNDFTPPAGGAAAPVIDPRFDLTLNLSGKNVRLKNGSELDARVGGYISLSGDLVKPVVRGRIAINQGRLTVPPRQFVIVPPGSIDLDYGNTGSTDNNLSVTVNLTARTKLTAMSLAGVRKLYTVTVTASGPLTDTTGDPTTGQSRMHLLFQTDPNDLANGQQALSERLATALFGIDTFNQIGHDPAQAAITALTNTFIGDVLPGQFNRITDYLNFEQLQLGYDPFQQLSLMVSRQLFGPIYVTYDQSLTAENRYYDVKVSLRLRHGYQVSYFYDEERTQEYLLEGVWRF